MVLYGGLKKVISSWEPTRNPYVERYNKTVHHEWLDMYLFESIEQAQELATKWLWCYNNERPNSAIGGISPAYVGKYVA